MSFYAVFFLVAAGWFFRSVFVPVSAIGFWGRALCALMGVFLIYWGTR
jgi:hypothetical protein